MCCRDNEVSIGEKGSRKESRKVIGRKGRGEGKGRRRRVRKRDIEKDGRKK